MLFVVKSVKFVQVLTHFYSKNSQVNFLEKSFLKLIIKDVSIKGFKGTVVNLKLTLYNWKVLKNHVFQKTMKDKSKIIIERTKWL